MRRFEDVWHWDGATLVDVTQAAGDGTASVVLAAGDRLYLGSDEPLAGVYADSSGTAAWVAENWDGDAWRALPTQESYTQQATGFTRASQGVDLSRSGLVFWGRGPAPGRELSTPYLRNTATPVDSAFPENATAPAHEERYWTRLRVTSGSLTVTRVLPRLYNTYTTVDQVASYLGLPAFDDTHAPTRETVAGMIAGVEDWLDYWTRKTWRLRGYVADTYDYNPEGFMLRMRPGFTVSKLMIWNGSSFDELTQGRGQDFWFDPRMSRIVYTLPSFRLFQYSHVLSRYLRQPGSVQVDWVAGGDYEVDERRELIWETVTERTCAKLVTQSDWTGLLSSGLEVLPKPEKVREWMEHSQQSADELRGLVTF